MSVRVGDIERLLRAELAGEPDGALVAYLFGSVARGEARPDSDVDVAVLLTHKPETLNARFGLESRLEALVRRPMHLVILNDAPPGLVHRVLRDGKLVLERDKSARIRFEVAARNAYFDTQPLRDRYRRAHLTPPANARQPEVGRP